MTEEEFQTSYLNGYTNLLQPGSSAVKRTHNINVRDLPAEVDWREKASVKPFMSKLVFPAPFTLKKPLEEYSPLEYFSLIFVHFHIMEYISNL